MGKWTIAWFWISFVLWFYMSAWMKKQEQDMDTTKESWYAPKETWNWKSPKIRNRYELFIKLKLVFGGIAISTFVTWLLFIADK